MSLRSLTVTLFLVCALTLSVDAGEWVRSSVTNAAGTRAFELYVPSGDRPGEKRPLLVAMHGCTQTSSDFAGLTRSVPLAEKNRLLLLFPSQSALANAGLCWNWFLEGNQQRGQGEPALIRDMVDWVRKHYRVDDRRVYVMGISAGGFMTSILLSCYSDVFAAGAVASGGMYEGAKDLWSAAKAAGHGSALDPDVAGLDAYRCSGSVSPRLMPVLVFDGSEDPYVAPANGRQAVAQFVQLNDLGDDGEDNGSVSSEPASTGSDVSPGGLTYTWSTFVLGKTTLVQHYVVNGMGHAWGGGDPKFAFAEPRGPDQTTIIWNFLRQHSRPAAPRTKRRAAGH